MKPTKQPQPPANFGEPTALQRSAVIFVAAMAEQVDTANGNPVKNGTRDTQKRVAKIVREAFFDPPAAREDGD